MRILATLDVPTAGEVLLDGHSLVDAPDKARPLIGYMPDRYGTYDDMTVFEFLDFFARAYGLKGAAREAAGGLGDGLHRADARWRTSSPPRCPRA